MRRLTRVVTEQLPKLASNAAPSGGSFPGMDRTPTHANVTDRRTLKGAEAAAVLRFGTDRSEGAGGGGVDADPDAPLTEPRSPAEGGESAAAAAAAATFGARSAVVGSITLAVLLAAGVGIPESAQNASNGARSRGSFDGSQGPPAVSSAAPFRGSTQREREPMLKNFIQASVVVGVGLIAGNADAQAVQWRVADGGNGHWYQFVPNLQSTWTAARSAAQAQGGHLATISGQSENAFMGSVVGWASSSWSSEVFGPFIGATRQGLSEWHWVTDEPWNFQGWASGEPNNDSGGAGPEDCLALSRTWMGTDILWNDVTNTGCAGATCQIRTSSGFVVEWESDCNSDGIVDYGQILNGSLLDTNTNGVPDCCDQGVSCEVNLVNNGGFEQGAAQACGWVCIPTGSTSLVGWDVVLNTVDRQRTIVGVCYEGWLARSGEYSIDLNGCSWGGKIQQSLTTVVGATYRLTFGLSLNPVPAVGYVRVFTGATQTDFSFQRADTSPQPWHEHFVNFTASSTSTVIAFESLNREAPDQWNGPVIDDVSVVLIHQSNCRGDIFADGLINGGDLGVMLSYWGQVTNTAQSRACDLNVDGNVDGSDLGVLLSNWGPCNG